MMTKPMTDKTLVEVLPAFRALGEDMRRAGLADFADRLEELTEGEAVTRSRTPAQSKTHREILAEEMRQSGEPFISYAIKDGSWALLPMVEAAMSRVSGPLVVTEEAIEALQAESRKIEPSGCFISQKECEQLLTAALPHLGRKEDTREEIIEECAVEMDQWAKVATNKDQRLAYKNAAVCLRSLKEGRKG